MSIVAVQYSCIFFLFKIETHHEKIYYIIYVIMYNNH